MSPKKNKTYQVFLLIIPIIGIIFFFQNCSESTFKASDNASSESSTLDTTLNDDGSFSSSNIISSNIDTSKMNSFDSTIATKNSEVIVDSNTSYGFGFSTDDINRLSESELTNTGSGVLCKLFARKDVYLGEAISLKMISLNWSGKATERFILSNSDLMSFNKPNSAFSDSSKLLIKGANPDGSRIEQVGTKANLIHGGFVAEYSDISQAGKYTRYFEVKKSDGTVVCRTNTVTITLHQGATNNQSKNLSSNCSTEDIKVVPYYTQWPSLPLCSGSQIKTINDDGSLSGRTVQAMYDFFDQDLSQLQGNLTKKLSLTDSAVPTFKNCLSGRALVSKVKDSTLLNKEVGISSTSYFDDRFGRTVHFKIYSKNQECID
ncbi:MAG: hypothetical protein KDD45_05575 [Bdellovibrionales bacterium]|nr:hypothetical protein [Bdellovibrionales bacterium]